MLSPTDISIDILVMCIYWIAAYRAGLSLAYNHLPFRHKIYLILFLLISGLYTFQTYYQLVHDSIAPVPVWDAINGINVLVAFILTGATYSNINKTKDYETAT